MTGLLAFYQQHAISPVHQDISDLAGHFARRSALYRQLGLPPSVFTGRTVLEVGPGSGDNAVYIDSLKPTKYVLVEPNAQGAADLRTRCPTGNERWEIREHTIEALPPSAFDVVLCEGVLGLCGGQARSVLEALVPHVAPNGLLVITCIDAISDHAEILRRALAQQLIDRDAPLDDQVATLRPIFAPHLATLRGMTRRVDDWIIDNLLNPASVGPPFSIPEACVLLDGRFEVLGCAPRFLMDWRWYKAVRPGNDWAIDSYWRYAHNLLDYRFRKGPRPPSQNVALMEQCLAFRQQVRTFEAGGPAPEIPEIEPSWFGRGQQYVSFVRT